jgi:hypothetical protein
MNSEIIYFINIPQYEDYIIKMVIKQLQYIYNHDFNYDKMHIIICSNSINILEKYSLLVNSIIKNNINYELYLITDTYRLNHNIDFKKYDNLIEYQNKDYLHINLNCNILFDFNYSNYNIDNTSINTNTCTSVYDNHHKICIIYNYCEIKNETKNQTNLAFLVNYGLDKDIWQNTNIDITVLVMINGKCEVLLPERSDIHIIQGNKFYSVSDAIIYFENKYKIPIENQFTELFIINLDMVNNESTTGPIYDNNLNNHWLYPFLSIQTDNIIYCNNCALIKLKSIYNYNNKITDISNTNIFNNSNYDDNIKFINKKLGYNLLLPNITECHNLINKNKTNKSCVIYCHYDNDNIIKDYVIQNLIILAILGYDIIFYTSSSEITNYDEHKLPFEINYYPNQNCGGGTDWYMWLDGSKKIKNQENKYDWIMFVNDSCILGINGTDNMKKSIDMMRNLDIDMWGHWDSSEIEYHYQSCFYEFKSYILDKFIEFAEKNLIQSTTKCEIVMNCETKFITYLHNNNIKTDIVIKEKDNKFKVSLSQNYYRDIIICGSQNPLNMPRWINDEKTFIIKWKYNLHYLNKKNISNEFRELLRFIHIGEYNNYKNIFQHIPVDLYNEHNMFFNPHTYLDVGSRKQSYTRSGDFVQFI